MAKQARFLLSSVTINYFRKITLYYVKLLLTRMQSQSCPRWSTNLQCMMVKSIPYIILCPVYAFLVQIVSLDFAQTITQRLTDILSWLSLNLQLASNCTAAFLYPVLAFLISSHGIKVSETSVLGCPYLNMPCVQACKNYIFLQSA